MDCKIFLFALSITLVGCQTTVPISYSPASTLSAQGELEIGSFEYLPASEEGLAVDEIDHFVGKVKIDQPVNAYFEDALLVELRFVGLKLGTGSLTLTGQIRNLHVNAFSANADLSVYYALIDAQGVRRYGRQIDIRNEYPLDTMITTEQVINRAIRTSIEQLLNDSHFRNLIR